MAALKKPTRPTAFAMLTGFVRLVYCEEYWDYIGAEEWSLFANSLLSSKKIFAVLCNSFIVEKRTSACSFLLLVLLVPTSFMKGSRESSRGWIKGNRKALVVTMPTHKPSIDYHKV